MAFEDSGRHPQWPKVANAVIEASRCIGNSAHVYEQTQRPNAIYIVDLGRTEYLDSSALGMLLLLREHTGGDQAQLRIVHCSPEIRKLLTLANFHQLFSVS